MVMKQILQLEKEKLGYDIYAKLSKDEVILGSRYMSEDITRELAEQKLSLLDKKYQETLEQDKYLKNNATYLSRLEELSKKREAYSSEKIPQQDLMEKIQETQKEFERISDLVEFNKQRKNQIDEVFGQYRKKLTVKYQDLSERETKITKPGVKKENVKKENVELEFSGNKEDRVSITELATKDTRSRFGIPSILKAAYDQNIEDAKTVDRALRLTVANPILAQSDGLVSYVDVESRGEEARSFREFKTPQEPILPESLLKLTEVLVDKEKSDQTQFLSISGGSAVEAQEITKVDSKEQPTIEVQIEPASTQEALVVSKKSQENQELQTSIKDVRTTATDKEALVVAEEPSIGKDPKLESSEPSITLQVEQNSKERMSDQPKDVLLEQQSLATNPQETEELQTTPVRLDKTSDLRAFILDQRAEIIAEITGEVQKDYSAEYRKRFPFKEYEVAVAPEDVIDVSIPLSSTPEDPNLEEIDKRKSGGNILAHIAGLDKHEPVGQEEIIEAIKEIQQKVEKKRDFIEQLQSAIEASVVGSDNSETTTISTILDDDKISPLAQTNPQTILAEIEARRIIRTPALPLPPKASKDKEEL